MWENKKKAVTFSYDDGVGQDIRLSEIFNEYGLKCTFNINSGLIGTGASWTHKGGAVSTRQDLATLKKVYKGHEVAVHGYSHANLEKASYEEALKEIQCDKDQLEKWFETPMLGMAYAFGTYNPNVLDAVKDCGLHYARTVKSSLNFKLPEKPLELCATCHHDDEKLFELADTFLAAEPKEPMLFYIWGHSYEFDGNNNWDMIKKFCKKIAGHSDVYYCTNAQALLPAGEAL